jgi:hypothetical protein
MVKCRATVRVGRCLPFTTSARCLVLIPDLAEIRTKRVRKQKTDRQDPREAILRLGHPDPSLFCGSLVEGVFQQPRNLSPSIVTDPFEKRQGSQHDLAAVLLEDTQILPVA